MFKGYYVLISFFIISSGAFAQFDDNSISPFLGPYKINKTFVGSCPSTLLLMAQCTLDRLDLKNTENPDFDFISFKGINAGEMITTVKNQIVQKSITTFDNLEIKSSNETYFSRYKEWFREKADLGLSEKKFILKKSKEDIKTKKFITELHCEYIFDEIANKKILNSFHSEKSK
ncbi:MAG: hypothetical protein Q7U04_15310 [Bacteriovorax sp.]|nr:hypothetical protein [Bacteriovorax sp.]